MIELPYMIRNAKFTVYGTARKHFPLSYTSNEWCYIILDEDIVLDNGQKCFKDAYFIFNTSDHGNIYYYYDKSKMFDSFALDPHKSIVSESTGILMAELYEMNEKNWFEYKINEALDSKDEEAFNKLMNSKLPNGLKVGTVFAHTPDGGVIKLGSMEVNINEC